MEHLRAALKEGFELRQWATASPWLASATATLAPVRPEALLAATVRSSATAPLSSLVVSPHRSLRPLSSS